MRRIRAATLALSAALVLGACDGGDDPGRPKASPTPSASTPAPSSTTPAVDPLTEAPKGETARQFIRRWVALSNRMQETGETEAFLDVAGPDCDSCRDYAGQIRKIYANDGYLKGGRERIVSVRSESSTQWVVVMDAQPTEYAESKGSKPKTLSGGKYRSRLYLARVGGRWIVGATEGLPL